MRKFLTEKQKKNERGKTERGIRRSLQRRKGEKHWWDTPKKGGWQKIRS